MNRVDSKRNLVIQVSGSLLGTPVDMNYSYLEDSAAQNYDLVRRTSACAVRLVYIFTMTCSFFAGSSKAQVSRVTTNARCFAVLLSFFPTVYRDHQYFLIFELLKAKVGRYCMLTQLMAFPHSPFDRSRLDPDLLTA